MSHQYWKSDSDRVRLYHFPPLGSQGGDTPSQASAADYQKAVEQGYQEGMEQGRQAGYQEGMELGRQEGLTQGMAEGHARGEAQAHQEMESRLVPMIAPITALQQLLREGHEQQLKSQQELILELVKRVAEQVVRCELTLHPQQILSLIEETLAAMPDGRQNPVIHLEPGVLATLNEVAADKVADWTLRADATLGIGDVRVVSEECEADASTASRLNACMEQVAKHLVDDHGQGA
ncbi:flagellar assembly protein H [Ferrimonas sediminicola]|uniref:Flagellar assembly protein FliH n=1 Tax=Ferrimonas sediminicola TaxID=2569538 RepID=A0A4U1BAD5_9GAMM|nr:flagellar assembly protein FliH [Ferrimonas sediminicola]TKB47786.1 flagellar assembly protein H [Ferrimonas sediminicola]